jgi:predicted aldo/keto reductase-like oxidoreductase
MNKRYIKKLNTELSPLGFGVMRLPMEGDRFTDEARRLIGLAMEAGINYYDTAYPYQRERSEEFIRETLVANYPRRSFHIADKLPVWLCGDVGDMERIFQIQLERLGVEHIDFYLLHGLHRSRWADIYGKGVLDFLERKRREGRMHRVGFSLHDTADTLGRILDAYDWDFAQLQINYYDWTVQHAKDNYDCLAERDIPCIVMEPVGGGRLAKLPGDAERLLKTMRPDASAASWAIGFVASLPNVAVTLSGMSDERQLRDNVSVFSPVEPLAPAECETLDRVVRIVASHNAIPCTSCRYCTDECPKEIDIPQIFQRYNDCKMFDNAARFDIDYFAFIPEGKRADACIFCGRCAEKCPQTIDVPKELRRVHGAAVELALGIDAGALAAHTDGGPLLVCFGAGAAGRTALALLRDAGRAADYFCDNARNLWGGNVDGVSVISPERLKELSGDPGVSVLITSAYHDEIETQLDGLGIAALNAKRQTK